MCMDLLFLFLPLLILLSFGWLSTFEHHATEQGQEIIEIKVPTKKSGHGQAASLKSNEEFSDSLSCVCFLYHGKQLSTF